MKNKQRYLDKNMHIDNVLQNVSERHEKQLKKKIDRTRKSVSFIKCNRCPIRKTGRKMEQKYMLKRIICH